MDDVNSIATEQEYQCVPLTAVAHVTARSTLFAWVCIADSAMVAVIGTMVLWEATLERTLCKLQKPHLGIMLT